MCMKCLALLNLAIENLNKLFCKPLFLHHPSSKLKRKEGFYLNVIVLHSKIKTKIYVYFIKKWYFKSRVNSKKSTFLANFRHVLNRLQCKTVKGQCHEFLPIFFRIKPVPFGLMTKI